MTGKEASRYVPYEAMYRRNGRVPGGNLSEFRGREGERAREGEAE